MNKTKQKISDIENKMVELKNKLQEYGWHYVADNFTKSDVGHRRERFERLNELYKKFMLKEIYDVVLIFHYKESFYNIYNEPSIQTYSRVPKSENEFINTFGKECCSLSFEETKLFFKFMELIRKKDLLLQKENLL